MTAFVPLARALRPSRRAAALATLVALAPAAHAQDTPRFTPEPSEAALAQGSDEVVVSHGYNFFDELSYPPDFEHFDYVNPDAPKGGEISLWAPGTFDSMNPYSRQGRAGRYSWMMYESLLGEMPASGAGLPADKIGESYGLLAWKVEWDPGKTWVIFHMRPEARFSDGTPVTAHDVVFSHNLLLEQGLPSYAQAVKLRVLTSEALDDHTVKFTFAEGISRRSLIDQVGGVPVWSQAWYEENDARLDEPRLDPAVGSGPYVLDDLDVNRSIVYRRNPDYWGWHLPINRGRHNFDRIRVEYFADENAAFEAFKAGVYTFRQEGNSRTWATGYDFRAVDRGLVKLEELPDGNPPTPNGIVFNLGREALRDKRVREAIALAYNFNWTNDSLQYGLFRQRHSFVQDTPLQAEGPPEGAELAFLESLEGVDIPEAVLTEPARRAHESSEDRLNDRRNLRRAMGLLDEAGWQVGDDGVRRNADGEALRLDFPISSSSSATLESVVETFAQNLELMGIDIRVERIDPSQYTSRSRERDYDLIFDSYRAFLQAGTGLMQMYGSREAEFSLFNPAGLASPLVDAVIEAALDTDSREEEAAALMALDRVLRHEFFMVPVWYNDSHWVAYWDQYDHPEELPPYALGPLDFWWYDAEGAEELRDAGALR
ncbi:extracellular solute-binding protein [Rhodosalinus sp.]|uniref:extracellular solute-binding protein n=1 Tax=Rhodosalinus sp. TaxID=2047741 RepID=UPI00397BC819